MFTRKTRQLTPNKSNNSSESSQFESRPFQDSIQTQDNSLIQPATKGFNFGKIAIESPHTTSVQPKKLTTQTHPTKTLDNSSKTENTSNQVNNTIQNKVIQLYDIPADTYTVADLLNHNIKEAEAAVNYVTLLQTNENNQLAIINQDPVKYKRQLIPHQKRLLCCQELIVEIQNEIQQKQGQINAHGNTSIIGADGKTFDSALIAQFHVNHYIEELTNRIFNKFKAQRVTAQGEPDSIKQGINDAFVDKLNTENHWDTITEEMDLDDYSGNDNQETFTSTLTPVNANFNQHHYAHLGRTGQASATENQVTGGPNNQYRTTNLWKSELKEGDANGGGDTIFESYRTGALAYSGKDKSIKKDKATRGAIARSKVRGLLEAIVVDKLQKMTPQDRAEYYYDQYNQPDAKTLPLTVVSSSLQTATSLSGEKNHILDQMAAFDYFNNQDQYQFNVDIDGTGPQIVFTDINIIGFNFAVNGLKPLGTMGGGATEQHQINTRAMEKLAQAYNTYMELMRDKLKQEAQQDSDSEIEDGGFEIISDSAISQKIRDDMSKVEQLWTQIQIEFKNYSRGHAYELPSRIANLAFLMGHTAHYNCKSGKDRTGMQDVEAKLLAHKIHTTGEVPQYENVLQGAEKENYNKLLFESGSLDIQKLNTGVRGYKIANSDQFEQRIIERMGDLKDMVKGLSKFTKA